MMRALLVAQPYADEAPLDNVQVAHACLRGFLDTVCPESITSDDQRMTVRATDVYYLLQPALNRLATAQAQLLQTGHLTSPGSPG